MSGAEALAAHLATGTTQICRLWELSRRDGLRLGFTDHDRDLQHEGQLYRADSGFSAHAMQASTGLSVDNTEALGLLNDAAIREEDLIAGRFDGAQIRIWLANWGDLSVRQMIFSGSLGEITRKGAEFRVELRGLAEPLNQPTGHAYTRDCSAVLGDGRCRFDLGQPGFRVERVVEGLEEDGRVLTFALFPGHDDRWFEGGRLEVLSGAAAGLMSMVKSDRIRGMGRRIELWQSIRAPLLPGDMLRLHAGCDKRAQTCRAKFANFLNFRGFPHQPGEDWLQSYPR